MKHHTVLSKYTSFNTGCLSPSSNCISTETARDLRKRIDLINEISLSLHHTLSIIHSAEIPFIFPRTNLHTVIADAAVGAARGSVEVTRRAPLHPHLDALHVHVLIQRSAELIILVLVLICWKTVC